MKRIPPLFLVLTMITVNLLSCAEEKEEFFAVERFLDSENCRTCHSEIYQMWEGSLHGLAHKDPVYLKASQSFREGLEHPDEIEEAESCVKCHTPIGYVSGYPRRVSDDRELVPHVAREGVSCDFCHSAIDAEHMYNNYMILDPGLGPGEPGIKRGPFDDAHSYYHENEYSDFHMEARVCGTCHNVRHVVYDTVLESTWDEWVDSPYNSDNPENNINCLGCHMYQRPGFPATGTTERPENPGKAAPRGPERDHIFTHYFVGANTLIPGLYGDDQRVQMAEARLQNAAELKIESFDRDKGILNIAVTNVGAGHRLPTGLTDVRIMWLEVQIFDQEGEPLYQSGLLDSKGQLPEETVIYNTVFGDGQGNKVINIAKAKEILYDKRIAPKETAIETFDLQEGAERVVSVKVRLLYGGVSPEIGEALYGDEGPKIPVTVMESLKANL